MKPVTDHDPPDLIPIGEFARLTRLSRKALLIYDDIGLLPPSSVDSTTGYRSYSSAQLATARIIGLLRSIDMSLSEIGKFIIERSGKEATAQERLIKFQRDQESLHAGRQILFRHIHNVLQTEGSAMFDIQTRDVAAQHVMSVQRRLTVTELDDFASETRQLFLDHVSDATTLGNFTLIYHGIVDEQSDGPIEAIQACPTSTKPTDAIGIRTEPAHSEVFTTITKAQWAFPAILAAYDAVACSPEHTDKPASTLSCREVYLANPDEASDPDLVCDVAFPTGPGLPLAGVADWGLTEDWTDWHESTSQQPSS